MGVLSAGVSEAQRRGFDLVSLDEGIQEVYVDPGRWPDIARELAIRQGGEANLLVRLPHGVWPFRDGNGVPDAVIAADLLDAAEPRAVSAGELRLAELQRSWRR